MKKSINGVFLVLIMLYPLFISANPGMAETDVMIGMRLYEGFRGAGGEPAKIISSYYLKPLSREEVFSETDTAKEEETLKRVFNLSDINRMTEANMQLPKENNKTPFQVIVLNGRKLLVQLSGIDGQKDRFRVQVFEDEQTPRSLLDSKLILPQEKSTVLGFEDSGGHIYFLSFHRRKDVPSAPLPPNPPLPVQPVQKAEATDIKDIDNPRLVHKVEPEYPIVAKKACVEGTVVIEAVTNAAGDVAEAKVISGHPLLRTAAVNAVKEWKYEPFIVNGEKKPVSFTVVLNFKLPKKTVDKPVPVSSEQQPRLINRVEPRYPEELVKAGVEGKIVVEAATDTEGNIIEVKVIDGNPLLDPLAVEAIKQWKYEPFIIDGVKKPVKFTVIVKFNLKKKDKSKQPTGDKK